MKKQDLLILCEALKGNYLKKVDSANNDSILPLLEANGLIPRRSESPKQAPPSRSTRPDLMELDSKSDGGKKIYDISKKKEPVSKVEPYIEKDTPVNKKATVEIPKETVKKEPKDALVSKDTPKDPESKQPKETKTKTLIDKSHGYPEIKLSEDLKNADESMLDGLLTKSDIKQILNVTSDAKKELYRNLLFCKESDIGKGDKYLCFNSNKGTNSVLTKGEVPVSYIDTYYTKRENSITRPDTGEKYAILGSKKSGSEELIEYISLKDESDKYIIFVKINDSELIMILNKTEYNLLFHPVE